MTEIHWPEHDDAPLLELGERAYDHWWRAYSLRWLNFQLCYVLGIDPPPVP